MSSHRFVNVEGVAWGVTLPPARGPQLVTLELRKAREKIHSDIVLTFAVHYLYHSKRTMSPLECWEAVERRLRVKGPCTKEQLVLAKGLDRVTVSVGLKYGLEHPESGLRTSIRTRFGSVTEVYKIAEV